ncbi:uncharacterized protein STAUR_3007 [Stigmatella aurantiaca DW4/3-1]|uniref:Conserved domain protein n=2 Tax=Stigmatella aurantiaca TaxID=41 RepID=Q090H5_STIAD|nr:uncharacterized protein STAUR_3007 [Stigmatella aurantiaca DW4/3-1]EAU66144.1 conserved domain protein [Stigmatella aurantiaca DW4/3-1]
MPYEDTQLGEHEAGPSQDAAPDEAPGRTPNSAEGKDDEERRMPGGEPGKTPGSAEGEDLPRRPAPPPY